MVIAGCLEAEPGQHECEIWDWTAPEQKMLVDFYLTPVLVMANEVGEIRWTHHDCEWSNSSLAM